MYIAGSRSSVAYAAVVLAAAFVLFLVMLWPAFGVFEDAFFGAAVAAVIVLAAACVIIPNVLFRSAALVAGSAFVALASVILFMFWVDDDDSLATILVALGGVASFALSWVFLWRHRRIESRPGLWAHFIAGMPVIGPIRTLWSMFA